MLKETISRNGLPTLRLSAALLFGLSAAGPRTAIAQRAELERILRREVLANGLEVVAVESHGVPLVTIEVDVRNGSFTQPPEYAGLAHMYEHMFFKANQTYPEPEAFLDRAAELGAEFNGTTTEERVNYYLTVPADSLEGGMQFLAAALRGPLFREDELDRERQVVIGEYDRAESNPFFFLTQEMTKALYPGYWSRKNTIGERTIVATTTPAQMRTIQQRYYVPNNSALIVAGDIDPKKVFALAHRMFDDWPRGKDPFAAWPIPPVPPLPADKAIIRESPVGAVTVLVQWQGPSVGTDAASTYAADVFSDVMNDATSAFQQHLVDTGLWESVGVNYYTLNYNGPITISGQTTPDKLRPALAALWKEIARFDDPGYITSKALAQVKVQRAVTTEFGIEKASALTHTIGFWWSVASLDYYMGYVDTMAGQSVIDLRHYADKYIVGKPHLVGVLIDPDARRAIGLTEQDLLSMPQGTR